MVFGQPSFRLGPPGRRSRGGMYKQIVHALLGRLRFCFLCIEDFSLSSSSSSSAISLSLSLSFIVAFLFRFSLLLFGCSVASSDSPSVLISATLSSSFLKFSFYFFSCFCCCVTVENLARRVKNKTHIVPGSHGWEWTC